MLGAKLPWSTRANATSRRLPIPALIDGTDGSPVEMLIRNGHWSFNPGIATPTLGFNQNYPGPTIRTRRDSELNLVYRNTLVEGVAVHGHGLHVPGNVDGGPQLEIPPDEEWSPTLSIEQPAATCWYHSPTHGKSGEQTYRGLAGLIIIDDTESDGLELPHRYGIDDLPVIIHDRTFDEKGHLVYSLNNAGEDGWYGDTAIINGAVAPTARVPAGKVRLRLLNGANARFYIVAFSDNRTFHKIASDGGLLTSPVPMTAMEMSLGERCEIIVDVSDGEIAEMLTLFEDEVDAEEEGSLSMLSGGAGRIDTSRAPGSSPLVSDASLAPHRTPLPQRLATITRPAEQEIRRVRDFSLTMDHDGNHGGHDGHAAFGSGGVSGLIKVRIRFMRTDVPFSLKPWKAQRRLLISKVGKTSSFSMTTTGRKFSSASITRQPTIAPTCITATSSSTKTVA